MSKTEQGAVRKVRRRLRFWLRLLGALIALFVIAVVVSAVVIAQDPSRAASGVNGFLSALDDGAKAVLSAPIAFFQALVSFVDQVLN
ncbi:hypothetical protein A8924_4433 [Saccharopolyspora erythraea NRRL 2338]|uniref:Uncharacterized protein n=2 Tax=Saccharopolyspora erythraea TaxID=1836 RepID=A4FGZ0_SACEN|nr:hypothetical protein [Saccharopolyspora erythraea]EQD81837.1 hypothetical protein N599_33945 [Saccharopolyspora erythraea D]PFG97020.1 hypothetical protein A8924_4433 [Saccharopolyspora erythraea NRRL 2338]QRK87229.1 hypothetical protein JQX30_20550 [Saccharopolyspora erythraea]CAM03315.1 hypothetical protein SACE_4044 [Saccharopolyspora erythraea NRRL 2338]